MILKNDSINPIGLRPELLLALVIADGVYKRYGQELVITSMNDGKHSKTSLHYSGCGVDLRTHYFTPDEARNVRNDLKNSLNKDFDVVLESDHIHMEYQPKK